MSPNQVTLQPAYFQQEASTLLHQIEAELQNLRQNFNIQTAHTLMRLTHTLKGAAATVGLDVIKTITQTLENAFKALCAPEASFTPTVEKLICEGYICLKQLLSVPLSQAKINEAEILERMAAIVSQLQQHLGNRFGQDSCLPTSAELGVDVTQSVFESGVTEYLDELSRVIALSDLTVLSELLRLQADVFIGLGESLRLPGFGSIAQATVAALDQQPQRVMSIAQIALRDYRAGQAKVLQGDRNQGGAPSQELINLGSNSRPQRSWITRLWQRLSQPSVHSISHTKQQIPAGSVVQLEPLSQLFQQCYENLQRLTEQQRKPVLVKLKGGDICIDHTVSKRLYKPILYLANQAFTRDIEMPKVRQRQGKPAVGTIQLAAKQADRHLVVCVWNNGCGSSPVAIRRRVQPYLDSLQGTITVACSPGKGTCFTLRIPVCG